MSRTRDKGTRFETEVVNYLQANGFPHAERRAMNGRRDRGDIAGIPGVVLEVKNEKALTPAAYVDEAAVEAANAGVGLYAAVAKRRQRGPADAYAIMPLKVLAALLRDGDEPELAALRDVADEARALLELFATWRNPPPRLDDDLDDLRAALDRLDAHQAAHQAAHQEVGR